MTVNNTPGPTCLALRPAAGPTSTRGGGRPPPDASRTHPCTTTRTHSPARVIVERRVRGAVAEEAVRRQVAVGVQARAVVRSVVGIDAARVGHIHFHGCAARTQGHEAYGLDVRQTQSHPGVSRVTPKARRAAIAPNDWRNAAIASHTLVTHDHTRKHLSHVSTYSWHRDRHSGSASGSARLRGRCSRGPGGRPSAWSAGHQTSCLLFWSFLLFSLFFFLLPNEALFPAWVFSPSWLPPRIQLKCTPFSPLARPTNSCARRY